MVPARKVGMAPANKHAAKVYRGPKRSQLGPATRRTSRLLMSAEKQASLELGNLRCSEGNNVGVGDFSFRELDVFCNDVCEEWWESIPPVLSIYGIFIADSRLTMTRTPS